MKRGFALLLAALALVAAACGRGDDIWFDGDFSAATSLAKQNGSLVMLAFETRWCTWCRRMNRETFSHPEVRAALDGVVALKLDAERGGKSLAARYGVDSYPTIVFTDGDGGEVDRIRGYLPPGEFIAESRRIRGGDTLARLLCVTGSIDEAMALQRIAVDGADATTAGGRRDALRRMEAGQEFGDRPGFESFLESSAKPVDQVVPEVS